MSTSTGARATVDNQEGNTVMVVGCGKQKQSEPAPAKEFYTSNYFRLRREYVEAFADEWFVLSALHGFVAPDSVVAPYDVTFRQAGFDREAFDQKLIGQAEDGTFPLEGVEKIVVLAGVDYVKALQNLLDEMSQRGVEVELETPLQRDEFSGIGHQMKWIRERIDAGVANETLV